MAKDKKSLKLVEPNADAETRLHDDHHLSVRLWLRMLACTNRIENFVRQNLQAKFETTLPRFDLMAQLERAPQGLKMSELSQRMMVTGGNVTGITDGLEKEGLVVREVDTTDRRVFHVKLSAEGQATSPASPMVSRGRDWWSVKLTRRTGACSTSSSLRKVNGNSSAWPPSMSSG